MEIPSMEAWSMLISATGIPPGEILSVEWSAAEIICGCPIHGDPFYRVPGPR